MSNMASYQCNDKRDALLCFHQKLHPNCKVPLCDGPKTEGGPGMVEYRLVLSVPSCPIPLRGKESQQSIFFLLLVKSYLNQSMVQCS